MIIRSHFQNKAGTVLLPQNLAVVRGAMVTSYPTRFLALHEMLMSTELKTHSLDMSDNTDGDCLYMLRWY